MLGYITMSERGAADQLLFDLAARLRQDGVNVTGAVQENIERDPAARCEMDLHVLTGGAVVRISQNLGLGSSGCRLDPEGLERAVGLVSAALEGPVDLMLVNKFGKQEVDGRGFRPVIGQALLQDVPVLTAVSAGNLDGFRAFAGDMAEQVPANPQAVADWCARAIRAEMAG